jgi:hypothetical protein
VDPLLVHVAPQLARDDVEKVLLGSCGRRGSSEPKARCQSEYVGVDRDPVDHTKRLVEHDVGGLSPHTGKLAELLHGPGDLSAKFGDNHLRCFHAVLGLGTPEANGPDYFANLLGVSGSHGLGAWPAREELGRYAIHAGVGGLRREKHAYHKLEGIRERECALDAGIQLAHATAYLCGSLALGSLRLSRHCSSSRLSTMIPNRLQFGLR